MMHEQSSATVVLGVETSGATGGIALLQDHKLIDTISFSLGGQLHSQLLLPAIKEILTKSNLHLKDLRVLRCRKVRAPLPDYALDCPFQTQ